MKLKKLTSEIVKSGFYLVLQQQPVHTSYKQKGLHRDYYKGKKGLNEETGYLGFKLEKEEEKNVTRRQEEFVTRQFNEKQVEEEIVAKEL